MNDQLTCITNQLSDFHGCAIRDEHYNDYWDMEAHLRECNGCIQRPTKVGFVCGPCYNNIEDAISAAGPWFQMLDGVDRAVQRDSVSGGKPGGGVPIAPVPLTKEEILSYKRHFTGTAERWVADPTGAADAVRFARAVRAATRNHPTAEVAHKIRRTRCTNPECRQLALVWNPPQYEGGQVIVACTACDRSYDQTSFEKIAAIEKPAKVA